MRLRNDQAHNRGPKGTEVTRAYKNALGHLEQLYEASSWLCRYPLILLEETKWDSYADVGKYVYRELRGDHHLVPQHVGETTDQHSTPTGSTSWTRRATCT
jgi:hypothetical protein